MQSDGLHDSAYPDKQPGARRAELRNERGISPTVVVSAVVPTLQRRRVATGCMDGTARV